MALTKVTYSMISGSPVNVLDLGADPTGFADSTTAFILAFEKSNNVIVPEGNYIVNSTIIIPPWGQITGSGITNTTINIKSDCVAFITQYWSQIRQLKVTTNIAHTKNLIEVGGDGVDAGRTVLSNVWVENAGQDGIQLIYGNLGVLENIVSINNGLNGIRFKNGNGDLNAWSSIGYIDVRGNGNDGLRVESGSSSTDHLCSKSNFFDNVISQNNTGFGVYIGTRSNLVSAYVEANGSGGVLLGPYAYGNEIKTVEGYITDGSDRPGSNIVYNYNANADYSRIFQEKTKFSGTANKGWRIDNNDSAGWLDCYKSSIRNYAFISGGSSADQFLTFSHEDYPTYSLHVEFGGSVKTDAYFSNNDIVWKTGTGSPENVVLAPVGSLYSRTDGGAGSTFYVKESGTGNTGWVAK